MVDEDTGDQEVICRLSGWKVVSVFDVSQTDGDALPEPPIHVLTGPDPAQLRHQLAAIVRADGFTFTTTGDKGSAALRAEVELNELDRDGSSTDDSHADEACRGSHHRLA